VHEFHFKLSKIKERMFTTTGKQIAAERHAFMVRFYEHARSRSQRHGVASASRESRDYTSTTAPHQSSKIAYALAGLFVFILALH